MHRHEAAHERGLELLLTHMHPTRILWILSYRSKDQTLGLIDASQMPPFPLYSGPVLLAFVPCSTLLMSSGADAQRAVCSVTLDPHRSRMSVSRWTGGNTFMARLTMEGGESAHSGR
jgi:hypothetical protein